MITLYNSDAITKICNLDDCLECLVTEEENGVFELELTYNISSSNFSYIQNNNVIEAKASDELGKQLFRIYYVSNEIDGKIYVKAQHITYDLIDNFVENITCTNSTCQNSFQTMLSKCQHSHKFKGYSDIEHIGTYNLSRVNALEAILGAKGSLLDTYGNGAKLKRDNYNIYLNKTRGSNNGVTISYSKNITGYKREIDETGVITCIYPFAKFQKELGEGDTVEETIVLPERFVNSKYINNYPHPKILAVDYSEKEIKDIASLRTQANKYFQETQKDVPNVNYKVEFIYLHQTVEYEDNNLKALELVGMGDTVTVIDERIGMNVEANVIKTVFNVLTDRYESIELGRFKSSINDIIGDLESSVDNALTQVNNMYVNFEVLDDKITSEVSKLEGDIKANSTLIEQTDSYIQSTVTDLNGKYTSIKQTVDNIDVTGKVSFSDLSTKGGTEIHGGNISTRTITADKLKVGTITANEIASNTITASEIATGAITADKIKAGSISVDMITQSSTNPVLKLFGNSCQIDASQYMGQGIGNAIRLKKDDNNYLYVGNGNIALYCTGSDNNESALCTFDGNSYSFNMDTKGGFLSLNSGVFYNNNKLAYENHTHSGYASSSHTHSGYATTSSLSNKLDRYSSNQFESGSHDPYYSDTYNLGWSSYRWQQVSCKYVYATNTYAAAIDNPVATINDNSIDDVLDDIIIESPNIVRMSDAEGLNEKLVININVLKENKNAHLFVSKDDGGKVVVNESSLLALALLEIQKLKQEIKDIKK